MSTAHLVKSTSGIRGIIGTGLNPAMIAEYGMAFGTFVEKGKVVVGRDSRPSGEMVSHAVVSGLVATGIKVIDIGVVPTPTVEIAVAKTKAAGGICVTASHNSAEWNALKFFNDRGEFITPQQYRQLTVIFEKKRFALKPYNKLGQVTHQEQWIDEHIKMVLAMKPLDKGAIKRRKFTVVVDAINGAGSVALPRLLEKLGVRVICINCKGDGEFVHMPEPVPANLGQLAKAVRKHQADLGMACDPDADRLVLVDDHGRALNEELTLTLAVRQVLKKHKGPVVINLSTSRVTHDIAMSFGADVHYARVGEANVVQLMHEVKARVGGEGNGGVIYPACHAGRDALVGAALVLSSLAEEKTTISRLVETFPSYYIIKAKAALPDDFTKRLDNFEAEAQNVVGRAKIDRRDGVRMDFDRGWVQLRSSNTEPIFRLIVETRDRQLSESLKEQILGYFR